MGSHCVHGMTEPPGKQTQARAIAPDQRAGDGRRWGCEPVG